MALSALQTDYLTGSDLIKNVRTLATELNNTFLKAKNKLEFLNLITASDMTALSLSADVQTQLAALRTALNTLCDDFDNDFADVAKAARML